MSVPVFEIIGAPGSGKTSLINHILKCTSLNSRPVISSPAIAIKVPRRYFRGFSKLSFALSNKADLFNKILLSGAGGINHDYFKMESDKNLTDFVDYSLGLIYSQESSWIRKSLIAKWWTDTFLNRMRLECSTEKQLLCLDDEPLSYRLSLFSFLTDQSVIRKYYEIMPLPSGVVHIQVSKEEILQRLRSRDRVAVRHKNLSEEDLIIDIAFSVNVANLARDVLESRGVPVLQLDGSNNIESNAECVINFVRNSTSIRLN